MIHRERKGGSNRDSSNGAQLCAAVLHLSWRCQGVLVISIVERKANKLPLHQADLIHVETPIWDLLVESILFMTPNP
jgi:hypothetical protein